MKAFSRLIEEKVKPNDCVMEWMTVGPIDTEDLRAASSILHIDDVVSGELLLQIQANHIKLS